MKNVWCFIVVVAMSCVARGTVWLRNPNDRGPAAVHAGSACLQTVADKFFYDPLVTRSKNMVILHTANMSAPAAEIGGTFLALMHNVIAEGVTMKGYANFDYFIQNKVNTDKNSLSTNFHIKQSIKKKL